MSRASDSSWQRNMGGKLKDTPVTRWMSSYYNRRLLPHSFGGIVGADSAFAENLRNRNYKSYTIKKPKHGFSASAILSLFDEFSSQAIMEADSNLRPGVSIFLKTELNRSLINEESITFICDVKRTGQILGFCEMEIFSFKDKKFIGRGRHIKYLPMGMIWKYLTNIIANPFTFSVIEYFNLTGQVEYLLTRNNRKSIGFDGAQNDPLDLFELSLCPSSDLERHITRSRIDIAGSHEFSDSNNNITTASIFQFVVIGPDMCNPMGSMHGGAVSMAAEKAAIRAYPESKTFDKEVFDCNFPRSPQLFTPLFHRLELGRTVTMEWKL